MLLKPSARPEDEAEAVRRFDKILKVRKGHLQQWLEYLRLNHPGYRNIIIDEDQINAYPEDGSIYDLLTVLDSDDPEEFNSNSAGNDPTEASNDDSIASNDLHPDDAPPPAQNIQLRDVRTSAETVVPNLAAANTEHDRFRDFLNGNDSNELFNTSNTQRIPVPEHLSAATIRYTPVSEYDNSILLFSMAFPTLFPTGAGDFNHARERPVTFEQWILHLIRYKDGRFARHSRFRYMAFNMHLRHKSKDKAKYFCKRSNAQNPDIEQLADALANGVDDKRFIHRLSRYGAELPGI